MARKSDKRNIRHELLIEKLKQDPFLTDSELASYLNVSVPTIRLDRMSLNIPELRERIMDLAADASQPEKSNVLGNEIEVKPGAWGISIMMTSKKMCFQNTDIVRGFYIYNMAETLAVSIVEEQIALVGVANIKYKVPIHADTKLVARGEVKEKRKNDYIVWVKVYMEQIEAFSCKFILNINNTGEEKK